MNFKVGLYRNNIPDIKHLLKMNKDSLGYAVSNIALATSVPVIAVTVFLIELLGNSEELTKLLDNLLKFYSYEGWEE